MRGLYLTFLLLGVAQAQSARVTLEQRINAATQYVQRAAGGELKPCPESFLGIGTPYKQCIVLGGDAAKIRQNFGTLQKYLYGPWRTTAQGSSYNWLRISGGLVYVRVQRNSGKGAPNLIYLDHPQKR